MLMSAWVEPAKQALIDVEIARAEGIGHAEGAVLEAAVPDEPVERVEVLDADARLRAAQELAPPDRGLGDPILHARLDPEAHVAKDHIGELVVRGERRPVPNGGEGLAPAVERKPADAGVPGVVQEHDPIVLAVPEDHGVGGSSPTMVTSLDCLVRWSGQLQRPRDAIPARRQIEDMAASASPTADRPAPSATRPYHPRPHRPPPRSPPSHSPTPPAAQRTHRICRFERESVVTRRTVAITCLFGIGNSHSIRMCNPRLSLQHYTNAGLPCVEASS